MQISSPKEEKININGDYKLILRLYILGKIPIIKINITKSKLEKIKLKEKIKNIDFQIIKGEKNFDKRLLEIIKKIAIEYINLKIEIGTESASLTSILVPAISTIIAIILRKKVKKFENQTFIVNPVYKDQNLIKISLTGIFEIKKIHIINIIYIFIKKRRVEKNVRTSHRRSYDYCNE